MEEDLKMIKKILLSMQITENYIDGVLIPHIIRSLEQFEVDKLTPNFLYRILMFELGRNHAEDVRDYFQQYREKGYFTDKLTDFLRKSKWTK
jgi:hypothetical protein